MHKRTIEFTNLDGNQDSEVHYFNLTQTELLELEASYDGGLEDRIKRIVEAEDTRSLIAEFKKLILAAYGVKSEDGKRFIKNEQLREEFTQSPAYDALFMQLATDEKAAADFVQGILPVDLPQPDQDKPLPPPPSGQ